MLPLTTNTLVTGDTSSQDHQWTRFCPLDASQMVPHTCRMRKSPRDSECLEDVRGSCILEE